MKYKTNTLYKEKTGRGPNHFVQLFPAVRLQLRVCVFVIIVKTLSRRRGPWFACVHLFCVKKEVDQWSALSISHKMIPQQIKKKSNEFRTAKN
jgi:hypothetical protein